jgi:hypothetical protein
MITDDNKNSSFCLRYASRSVVIALVCCAAVSRLRAAELAADTASQPGSLEQNKGWLRQKALDVLPGQRMVLSGDSIVKGYGFGNYTNPSPLRTIYGIANILLKDNLPHPPPMRVLPVIWEGLNADGSPKTVDTMAGEVQENVRRGELRPGDWLIYEDAGELDKVEHPAPWPDAKNMYGRQREALRGMVLEADNSIGRDHVMMMTMFDYDPKAPWCKWDAPMDDGVHTGNDAIRDEASALGVRVIDMNRIMDRAEDYIMSGRWGRVVGPDGIHPNVFGNYVMTLAILGSLGADIDEWKLDGLSQHFRHPAAVETVWGFKKDPTDEERLKILNELRKIVVAELRSGPPKNDLISPALFSKKGEEERTANPSGPTSVGFKSAVSTGPAFHRLLRHGRILDHPARQPGGTTKVASYELGKLFQLDRDTALLAASLREQGGHDFEIGNDGFIFRHLAEIVPERAILLNRLEPDYQMKSGKNGVLSKYPFGGAIVPLGAKLRDGRPHPGAGTGFFVCSVISFLPDRSEITPDPDEFVEFYQVRWDGHKLKVTRDKLPEPFASNLKDIAFNAAARDAGFVAPFGSDLGMQVLQFDYLDGRWQVTASGKPFGVGASDQGRIQVTGGKVTSLPTEIEPSIVQVPDGYLVYTRGGNNMRGRLYRSSDGLNYHFAFDHYNHTVPQVLNQGLDGDTYLTTCTGPGWLRNPLLAFPLHGQSFVNPIIVHDEKQIGDDKHKEVPFVDHGVGANIHLNGRWRHLLCYRVLDLHETDGQGAPPTPQTGLYLAELEYDNITQVPFHF